MTDHYVCYDAWRSFPLVFLSHDSADHINGQHPNHSILSSSLLQIPSHNPRVLHVNTSQLTSPGSLEFMWISFLTIWDKNLILRIFVTLLATIDKVLKILFSWLLISSIDATVGDKTVPSELRRSVLSTFWF